jgi:chemotaxis protein MotA
MGMIGTLIGLVAMLTNMDDPKSIGPAMAVALLTTLYGAFLANVIAIPIAAKLKLRSEQEQMNQELILDAVLGIQDGQNPRVIEGLLKTYLAESKRSINTTEDE